MDGPAVQGASATLDAARAARCGACTSYVPGVTASCSRSGNGSGPDFSLSTDGYSSSGALRLSLSLPIFEDLQRVQQVTQAQVAVENAQAALRDARHDLIQARYDQRVAKAQLEALTARSL